MQGFSSAGTTLVLYFNCTGDLNEDEWGRGCKACSDAAGLYKVIDLELV